MQESGRPPRRTPFASNPVLSTCHLSSLGSLDTECEKTDLPRIPDPIPILGAEAHGGTLGERSFDFLTRQSVCGVVRSVPQILGAPALL